MTKSELIQVVAKRADVTQKEAETVINALTATITETLAKRDEPVIISGFGSWVVRKRAARAGVAPRDGKPIQIPEQKSPAFKAGKALKDAVKGVSKAE
ncbi:MAG: HU family DNA-binding protein [Acholeplasmatales bacterium]|jgi:DNA-binding protein HU-beta|nr:HU family DNA-binding protein [Acholeplasmatales bacterium]